MTIEVRVGSKVERHDRKREARMGSRGQAFISDPLIRSRTSDGERLQKVEKVDFDGGSAKLSKFVSVARGEDLMVAAFSKKDMKSQARVKMSS